MESEMRYLVDQGKLLFKNQDYEKAEKVLSRVISVNQDYADVYNVLGMIAHQGGEFGKSINYFKKALKLNANYTEALLNLSVLYNDIGEYKNSKQLLNKCKRISKKGSDHVDPYLKGKLANKHAEMGDLYHGVGLNKRAIDEYNRALELAPEFHDIRVKMGVCLREEGLKEDALKEFKKIMTHRPQYAQATIQYGITLYSLGKRKEARVIWNQLVKSNPKNQVVRMYLRLTDKDTKNVSVKAQSNENAAKQTAKKQKPKSRRARR